MRTEENRSFTDFVAAEQGPLLRLAVLLAGDRGQAEDLVQTALMKSYRHWARITRSGTPSAYVRRVLVTTHTSWRRRLSSTEQLMETVPERADPHAMPTEHDEQLRQALQGLPPRMRAAVVLRFYEDLTVPEIAERLAVSDGAVKRYLSLGVHRLEGLLGPITAPVSTVTLVQEA
jgi:RNA polymerase sigma-70 factor (sigma-E family)